MTRPRKPSTMTWHELHDEVVASRALIRRMKQHQTRRERRRYANRPRRALAMSVDARPLGPALCKAGWTQRSLADALGTSRNSVCHWISGARRIKRSRAEEIVEVFRRAGVEPPAFEGLA